MDIISGVVTKIAKSYSSMLPKMDAQAELETKYFSNIDALLGALNTMVSNSSSYSLFTLEFFNS